MSQNYNIFTTIHHAKRIELGMSLVEWCIADMVYVLQNADGQKCDASRVYMAEVLGVSRRSVIENVDNLVAQNYLQKTADGNLTYTRKWASVYLTVQKMHSGGAESALNAVQKVHLDGAESAPNNNSLFHARMREDVPTPQTQNTDQTTEPTLEKIQAARAEAEAWRDGNKLTILSIANTAYFAEGEHGNLHDQVTAFIDFYSGDKMPEMQKRFLKDPSRFLHLNLRGWLIKAKVMPTYKTQATTTQAAAPAPKYTPPPRVRTQAEANRTYTPLPISEFMNIFKNR
jgi:hypothetical protein